MSMEMEGLEKRDHKMDMRWFLEGSFAVCVRLMERETLSKKKRKWSVGWGEKWSDVTFVDGDGGCFSTGCTYVIFLD